MKINIRKKKLALICFLTGVLISTFLGTTLVKADEEIVLTRGLGEGMSGEDVRFIQEKLWTLGYLAKEPDGEYDGETAQAVSDFQRSNGLYTTDGMVGEWMQWRLNHAANTKADTDYFQVADMDMLPGDRVTIYPVYYDMKAHELSLSTEAENISIHDTVITALDPGTAIVTAQSEGHIYRFPVYVMDASLEDEEFEESKYTYASWLMERRAYMQSAKYDKGKLLLLAGDSYFDERCYFVPYFDQLSKTNTYSVAMVSSRAMIWTCYIQYFFPYKPETMAVSVGYNELYNLGLPVEKAAAEIETLLLIIMENLPDTKLFWWEVNPRTDDFTNEKVQALNAAVSEFAEQYDRITVVDTYSVMTDGDGIPKGELYYDGVHPNADGYALLLEKAYEAGMQVSISSIWGK